MLSTMSIVASSLALFGCLYSGVAVWRGRRHVGTEEARQHGNKRPFRKLRPPAFDCVQLDCGFAAATVKGSLVRHRIVDWELVVVSSKDDRFHNSTPGARYWLDDDLMRTRHRLS